MCLPTKTKCDPPKKLTQFFYLKKKFFWHGKNQPQQHLLELFLAFCKFIALIIFSNVFGFVSP